MAQTIYNLDAAWSGLEQDSKWVHVETDEGTVVLDQFEPENGISLKIQVTSTQLSDHFSTHTWQWAPGGGETAYYFDEEGDVQSTQGDLVTAKMKALGNYFKTEADATEAAKKVTSTLLKYHDELGY